MATDIDNSMDGRRYPPSSDAVGDISDEPADNKPVRDWIRQNKLLALSGGLIVLLLIVAVWAFLRPFVTALRNPIVYGVLLFALYTGFVWLNGGKYRLRQHRDTPQAVLQLRNGCKVYDGEIETDRFGNRRCYPIKSWQFFGLKPKYLKVKNVSKEFSEVIPSDADPDDRFFITIGEDKAEETFHKRHGHVVVANGDELEPDSATAEAGVRLTEPDTVDEDSYHDLASAFRDLRHMYQSSQQENHTLRNEVNRLARKLEEQNDKSVDKFIRRSVKLREAEQSTQNGQQSANVVRPVETIFQSDNDE